MNLNTYFIKFWEAFIHPRVIAFILIGTGVIFFTFFTNNNALEIAISGIASVFIGIGVNNLSAIETHLKDEQKIRSKTGHLLKVLDITKKRINRISIDADRKEPEKMKAELAELEQLINLSIQLINEDKSLD